MYMYIYMYPKKGEPQKRMQHMTYAQVYVYVLNV